MGTNYYWYPKAACECCKREYPSIHIGKSSSGWCFGLHVFNKYEIDEEIQKYVTEDIKNLEDWKMLWNSCGYILNEYEEIVSTDEMLSIITDRKDYGIKNWDEWRRKLNDDPFYSNESHFHKSNHSQRGPNNLLRHKIEKTHCVGHGEGTWDYIRGEFS